MVEEEEEALRLQREAAEGLRPEDYGVNEEDGEEEEDKDTDDEDEDDDEDEEETMGKKVEKVCAFLRDLLLL